MYFCPLSIEIHELADFLHEFYNNRTFCTGVYAVYILYSKSQAIQEVIRKSQLRLKLSNLGVMSKIDQKVRFG